MLVLKYTLFAIFSTGINLLFQYFSFVVYSGVAALYIAMFVGTLAGLISKYTLDKKYIFYHIPENKTNDARKFLLYSFTGALITIFFWGTEIAFNTLYQSPYAKYLGAVIGLSIGYVIKFFLDTKYVFVHKTGTEEMAL